jgi:hypothetical protein
MNGKQRLTGKTVLPFKPTLSRIVITMLLTSTTQISNQKNGPLSQMNHLLEKNLADVRGKGYLRVGNKSWGNERVKINWDDNGKEDMEKLKGHYLNEEYSSRGYLA